MKHGAVFSVAIGLLWNCSAFGQQAPRLLPFQGRLTDQSGLAVSNGVRLVQFKIFEVPSVGSPVWAGELHRTTVNGGLVNVLLGSKTPFTGVDFDRQLYLEIIVDINNDNAITAADPPMLPRQAILPVVFAKESADSRKLAGGQWSDLLVSGNDPKTSVVRAEKVEQTLVPPGAIFPFAGNSVPQGWLLCDGRGLRSQDYPSLFAAIGTNWGSGIVGTVTNFDLPDLRSMFLRGANAGRSDAFADPDRDQRVPFAGGNSGNRVGSYQQDGFASHSHLQLGTVFDSGGRDGLVIFPGANYGFSWIAPFPPTSNTGGNETRPKNAYVNYIIKY